MDSIEQNEAEGTINYNNEWKERDNRMWEIYSIRERNWGNSRKPNFYQVMDRKLFR